MKVHKRFMTRRRVNLDIPTIRRYREAVEKGDVGNFVLEACKRSHAGSVKIKYLLKNEPYVVILEVRKLK